MTAPTKLGAVHRPSESFSQAGVWPDRVYPSAIIVTARSLFGPSSVGDGSFRSGLVFCGNGFRGEEHHAEPDRAERQPTNYMVIQWVSTNTRVTPTSLAKEPAHP